MKRKGACSNMSGFFFYPADIEGLEELTLQERYLLLTNQGNCHCASQEVQSMTDSQRIDIECTLDNSRLPTHRIPGTKNPTYGSVPFNF